MERLELDLMAGSRALRGGDGGAWEKSCWSGDSDWRLQRVRTLRKSSGERLASNLSRGTALRDTAGAACAVPLGCRKWDHMALPQRYASVEEQYYLARPRRIARDRCCGHSLEGGLQTWSSGTVRCKPLAYALPTIKRPVMAVSIPRVSCLKRAL